MLDHLLQIKILESQIKAAHHQVSILAHRVAELQIAHTQECQISDALGELVEDMADHLREQQATIEKLHNENEALKALVQETNRLCWVPSDAGRREWLRLTANLRRLGQ